METDFRITENNSRKSQYRINLQNFKVNQIFQFGAERFYLIEAQIPGYIPSEAFLILQET